MFSVSFHQDFGRPSLFRLTDVARLVSLSGFDALNYATSVPQNGSLFTPSSFVFRQQPFSLVLFVNATTRSEFRSKISQLQTAFRQFRKVNWYHLFIITNLETSTSYEAPVLVETVSLSQQTGLSATVTITGVRLTKGLFVGTPVNSISVSTDTGGLPKTVTLDYPYSFPAPLRIELNGPIGAGFQISRIDNNPIFDFVLTVGTGIPSGSSVIIDYGYETLNGSPPLVNAQYLANPEIAPDITVRPQSIYGYPTNTFTLSGPSSTGSVTISTIRMSWSIYE